MSTTPRVSVEAHQNEFLPTDGRIVDAVLTVTGSGEKPPAVSPEQPGPRAARSRRGSTAEIVLIDVSASMSGHKLRAAKDAAAAAIGSIPNGVAFGIVAGDHAAWSVYPPGGKRLAIASRNTRREARSAVKTLETKGGTAIGEWLRLAADLFEAQGAAINHAILLTDGENGEAEQIFDAALDRCTGRFVCDSRGVGDGWLARDLIKIAERLLGTASGITDPDDLEADFVAMTEAAMSKTMADVVLRVWTPAGATIRLLKQVHPEIVDLAGRRTDAGRRIGDYPIGAWGAESRDYHLQVELEPNPVGEEVLAARVSVVHGDEVLGQALVRAVWTDDLASSTSINRQVAHYTNETELADAIQEGLDARAHGDEERATTKLGRAVQLAAESGREDTAKMLAKVVEVVDERTGTVRLRKAAAGIDVEMAAVASRKTQQVRPARRG